MSAEDAWSVGQAFEAIERWQPVTNAFTQIYEEDAPSAQAGDGLPLSGVPVAVKDLFDIAGKETTGCSEAFAGNVAKRDSELVTRLRRAGAVIVGKTNMHELAMGGTNLLSSYGRTCNPWDPARITGGSSGGSAAAVASGVVRMALGTDTGGSIRNPAVLCGIWGLKPTHGRLPLDGVMALAPSLDCPGPMAITARELELLWRVISASVDAPDSPASRVVPERVGLLGGHFARLVHPDIRSAVEATRGALATLGSEIVQIDGEGIEHTLPAWVDLVCAEMTDAHPELANNREKLFPRTAGFVAQGVDMYPEQRAAAFATTREVTDWFESRFESSGAQVLLAPSSPYPASLATQEEVEVGSAGETVDVQMGGTSIFTRPVNMAGLPAIAIPAGHSPATGLPVGVQLIGRRGEDELLLGIARTLEEVGGPKFQAATAPFPG